MRSIALALTLLVCGPLWAEENALITAIKKGDTAKVATLLKNGAKSDYGDNFLETGFTPFMEAAWEGQKGVLELLVSWGVDPKQVNSWGDTALHLASRNNRVDCIAYLIEQGISVNYPGNEGLTPLMSAVLSNATEAATILLSLGADPELKDKSGETGLNYVYVVGSFEMYRLIGEHGHPGAALRDSVRNNALSEVQRLLAEGEPKDAANRYGETPLYLAVTGGFVDIARALIAQGAAVDTPASYYWRPLYAAAWRGDLPMVKLLLEHGVQVNAAIAGGDTAVGIALERGHQEVAAALIEAGANVLFYNPDAKTRRVFTDAQLENLRASRQEGLIAVQFEKAPYPFWLADPDPSKSGNPDDTVVPVFTRKVTPIYPAEGLVKRIQGYTVLQVILGKDGVARDISVLRTLGRGRFGFERESIKALRQWQFKPGTIRGKPADVRMTVKIDFALTYPSQ